MEFEFVLPARVLSSRPVRRSAGRAVFSIPDGTSRSKLKSPAARCYLSIIHLVDIFGSPCSSFGLLSPFPSFAFDSESVSHGIILPWRAFL